MCSRNYKKINISYIYSLNILTREKKNLFGNFRNHSKGIFGNHLTANGCQNINFCNTVKIWKKLKNGSFNPLMHNAPKCSDTLKKSCSICYKISKVGLTILRRYALMGEACYC